MNNKVEALKQEFERAKLTNNPKVFFQVVRDFVHILVNEKQFTKLLKKIANRRKKLVEPLKVYKKNAYNELKSCEQEIRTYLLDNNIYNAPVTQLLDSFLSSFKTCNVDRLSFSYLENVLYLLLNDGSYDHSEFVSKFGKIYYINDDKNIKMAEAFPHFHAWEKEYFYFCQSRQTTDWYALNQLLVFYERYDWRHYDDLEQALIMRNTDITRLQDEHLALMEYASAENPIAPKIFPTIDEYKQYMSKIIESIIELMPPTINTSEPRTYTYEYNPDTGELMIDDEKPLKFIITKGPAGLLKIMTQHTKKMGSFIDVYNKLNHTSYRREENLSDKEEKEFCGFIRQTNNRLKPKPPFILTQEDKNYLKKRNLFISSAYRSK